MIVVNDVVVHERERRRYQRIDDEIVMFWRKVKPDEVPEEDGSNKYPSEDFTLALQKKLLNFENAEILKRIGRVNPLLAGYLVLLERKVVVLASALTSKGNLKHCHSTHHVNLSASGLAFLTEKQYPLGTILELRMILAPPLTSIVAYGRVIYCIHYDDDKPLPHRIGVGFIRLHDDDRELLTGYVESRIIQGKGIREAH